jgi:sugar lactone lactonase YvrE
VYIGDYNNNTIRKITPAGVVTTLAGLAGSRNYGFVDGTGSAARFDGPTGLAVDAAGNLYVADSYNDAIRLVTPEGVVTTLAGGTGVGENIDGPLLQARFYSPSDVALDANGIIYVADSLNCTIRRITRATTSAPLIAVAPSRSPSPRTHP